MFYQSVVIWHRIGRCVLRAVFTDTVTVYNQISDSEWKRTFVEGVQWSEKTEKQNNNGKLSIVKYVSVTFPEGTYEGLTFNPLNESDCIVLGIVEDVVTGEKGNRITDLLKKHPESGLIKAVKDNSSRDLLKNIKVVLN